MTPLATLPQFPFWDKIPQSRKLLDGTSHKKWYLPDCMHYMDMYIQQDRIHLDVVREGYGDKVIEHNFWLHDRDGWSLLNIAAVLAERSFCRVDPPNVNRYKSGN